MRKMNGKPSVGVLENWRSRIIELEKNPWIKKNRKNMCIKLSYPFTERMRKCELNLIRAEEGQASDTK